MTTDDGGARAKGPLQRLRRRRRKHRLLHRTPIRSRRRFVIQGLGLLGAGAGVAVFPLMRSSPRLVEIRRPPVRPPTAGVDEGRFQSACIRCGLCGTVCENGCIRMFGLDEDRWGALTPYLDVRRRSCTLCMRCTQICPTDALTPVEDDLDSISDDVRMGTAVVDPDRCLSYLGRVCGYCHDACPLPGKAIRLVPPAIPMVIEDGCVGCGRCVELCPQTPTAIDVERELA